MSTVLASPSNETALSKGFRRFIEATDTAHSELVFCTAVRLSASEWDIQEILNKDPSMALDEFMTAARAAGDSTASAT
jgi:hypothetical protein